MLQALVTIPVIDSRLRFPQLAGVLTHEEIRQELIRQLDAGEVTNIEVARLLGIAPARVTEMRAGKRRVQQDEMPILAAKLKLADAPGAGRVRSVGEVRVPLLGKVAQGVWLEQDFLEPEPDEREYVSYDREPGDPAPQDLFAVDPAGTSMNLVFRPGMRLICRRVPFGAGQFQSGDYVIVARKAHNLHEMTCKRVEIDGDGVFWLHSESDDPRFEEPWRLGRPDENHHDDNEIEVVAKVIRAVLDFERARH